MIRCVSRLAGVLAFVCVLPVHALGLGEMRVQSALGEPFVAEIGILSATADELSTIEVTLGTPEVFSNSGVDRPQFLTALIFEVDRTSTPPVIRVTTELPVTEPFLHVIIRTRWEFGMLLSEYTALLDPPLYGQQQPGSVSTPVVVEEADQPVVTPLAAETAAPQSVAPMPQVSAVPAGGFEYGPVAPGDNLWGIASLVDTAGLDANIFQVMVALLRENPEAFIDNNINRLKIGEKLRLADYQSVLLVSKSEASRTYTAQIEQWEKSRSATAVAAQPDAAQPKTELIQEEAGAAEDAAAEPTATDVAKLEPAQGESAMEAVDKAVPAEEEDKAAEAQPAGKDKYVFKIAPPESEAGEGATAAIADAEVEVEAMRAAIDREISALREQVARLESQQRASEAASTTDAEIEAIKAEAGKEINTLREQIAFLKQAAADQEILALRGQIAEMKRAEEMSADASGASAALSQAQQEIRELRTQIAALTRSAAEKPAPAPQDFSDLSNQVNAPRTAETATAPSDATTQIAAVREAANEQITTMREQMEAMRAEMGKLLESQKQADEENTRLENRITELVGMIEGKVESTSLATLTTPSAASAAESPAAGGDGDSGAGPKKASMDAGLDTAAPPVWQKWLDQLPEDNESRIAIAAGVLLILLVLWLMVRRRRALLRMEESILMTGGTLDGTVSHMSEIRSKKPRYLSDLRMAGMGRMEAAAEVDPLAEAEVYLAYSRTGQAVQVLQEAIRRNPERKELHLKLLELFQQQGDVKSFDDLVSEMDLSEASADQAAWNRVVELKLKMHEGSPLGTPEPVRNKAPVDAPSSKFADQDWELALDDTDHQESRIEADSGEPRETITQTSGPVDPALQPFPEPDDDARVGEDVLGTLGRPAESSAAPQSDAPQSDLLPRDPELMNFNTTNPSELRFELDPDEDDAVMLEAGSNEPDSGEGDLSPPDQEVVVAPDQDGDIDEVAIKAELAEAYLNMGDKEEALRILKEILDIAGPDQKQYIADLMMRANRSG